MTDQVQDELDLEWIELIESAREIGITIDEIREFIKRNRIKKSWESINQ